MKDKIKIKLKTPITYYGGKQKMLQYILPLMPEHNLYCEPFAGGAAVFFAKEPVSINVINDLNNALITFYKVLKSKPEELKSRINDTLHSREQHNHAWYVYSNLEYFTDVDCAWAVFVLSKQGFAGQFSSSFGFDKKEGKYSLKVKNAKLLLTDDLIGLLERTTIECDDALAIIKRFDYESAFFFVDPPYVNANMGHYSGMFNEQNLTELLTLLAAIKGKFMLTMYPLELIKQFADRHGWTIKEINRKVSVSTKSQKDVSEWLVMNY